ncbi:MAG: hypothetical protein R3E58_00460 [Phycisphaerae bacterium]
MMRRAPHRIEIAIVARLEECRLEITSEKHVVKHSAQRLCESAKPVLYSVNCLDASKIRADFADLMDQCANAVTMEHGLDLDDVLMERFAVACDVEAADGNSPPDASHEVPIPFVSDLSVMTDAIVEGVMGQDAHRSPERLVLTKLIVRVFLESGVPLFNQAGEQGGFHGANPPETGLRGH